ncbi:MAG TPA: SusD/RagB family nutrient-binding outer membrane lipoprotein [Chryseosolibacter sp.]
MKTIFKYASAILAVVLCGACDDFLDVNTDPTRLKDAQLTQVISAAESNLAFSMGSDLFLYSSIFSQQAAGQGVSAAQTREYDKYILTNTDVNNAFSSFYATTLADLNYAKGIAIAQGNPQHAGIAKIMEAFAYSIIVDAWGSVPYRDAMQGVANVQPSYNDSKEIYDSLFITLDEGIAHLSESNVLAVGAEDLIYAGDLEKWKRFANTLKLRLALHYAKDDNGAMLMQVVNAGGPFMSSNADNFQMIFENVTNRQNPIHQFELSRADYYAASDFMINLMKSKSDPRLTTYFTSFPYAANPALTAFKGTVPGDVTTVPYSRIGTYLRGAVVSDNNARTASGGLQATSLTYTGAAPLRMLTFAEYNFIRAEAALVYNIGSPADAATFFKAGVDASLANAAITGSNATSYSSAATSGALTLQKIIEEKYVANLGVAMEPWSDWRRTGFPVLTASPSAVVNGNTTIPRILVYPLSEQQTNLDNVPERASIAVKGVFWDK